LDKILATDTPGKDLALSAPTSSTATDLQNAWRLVPIPVMLALGLGVLPAPGWSSHAEAAAAVAVWYESTAYSHCYFVLPIAAYLAWERRRELAGVKIDR